MVRLSSLVFWVLLSGLSGLSGWSAAQNAGQPPAPNIPGQWIELPKDGRPWKHPTTDLQFPAHLGEFRLSAGFQDKRAADGVALTYVNAANDLKADVVIFPCGVNLATVPDVLAMTHSHIEVLADDLVGLSKNHGYTLKQRSAVTDQPVPLWGKGQIPMSSLTLDMTPTDEAKAAGVNPINHWLGLLVYQDHFVQISMVMPSASMTKLRKPADQLITHLLHCIRYPSLVPEMIKLGQRYLEQPLKDAGRQAADSLLTLSKESPVFEVVVPGEALTPCIDEVNKQSPQSALDLLRGFIVGSSLATLQGGSTEASLDEGARGMIKAWEALRAQKQPVHSIFLEELRNAVEEKRAATFLQDKMRTAASVR